SPTVIVQPMITSSISAGSRSLRATRALSGSDARSTACQSSSFPLRRPTAVRTASTMTALAMRRARASVVEAEDAGGVGPDDLRLLVGGDVAHLLFDDLARVGPVVAVVGVIRRPHDVVDAHG